MELPPTKTTPFIADGDVNIYHGDCRDILNELPSESIDMVLTDPPYGVGYRGRWCSDWDELIGDRDPAELYTAYSQLFRVLKPNSFCLSFYGWPDADLFVGAWKLLSFRPVSHIVCVKNNIGLGYFARGRHETAYLLAKGQPPRPQLAASDVFEWERESPTYHPCQKPLQVISRLLATFSPENAVILDPFMGSGTTLLAARNLGCRAIGIEIDERYCQVASDRLAQQRLNFGSTRPIMSLPDSYPLFDWELGDEPWHL
jgi:site-specific DNA-methyltransferase (adenine-specific)